MAGKTPGKDLPIPNDPNKKLTYKNTTENYVAIAKALSLTIERNPDGYICCSTHFYINELQTGGLIKQGIFIHTANDISKDKQRVIDAILKMVGPDGDPDGDGVPNKDDEDPYDSKKGKKK